MAGIGRILALAAIGLLVSSCGSRFGGRIPSLPASPTRPVAQRPLGPMTLEPGQTAPAPGQQAANDAANTGEKVAGVEGGTGDAAAATDAADGATSAAGLAGGAAADGSGAVTALATPPADANSSVKLGRADLLGGWKITSDTDQCQLFMNLTSWKGGYRATTRGCSSPALQNISAWDLNGRQVTLKDGNGAAIATVFPTEAERFSGQTAGGSKLSVFR